jgi:hypothetical protein
MTTKFQSAVQRNSAADSNSGSCRRGYLWFQVQAANFVGSETLWLSAYLGNTHIIGRPRLSSKEVTVADSQKMKITRRAYELWQQAGEPKDRDEEFYLQAERELNEAPENEITATISPAPSQGRL